jgi:hypothetical protein
MSDIKLAMVLWQASFSEKSSRNRLYYPRTARAVQSFPGLILEPSTALAQIIRLWNNKYNKGGTATRTVPCHQITSARALTSDPACPYL